MYTETPADVFEPLAIPALRERSVTLTNTHPVMLDEQNVMRYTRALCTMCGGGPETRRIC